MDHYDAIVIGSGQAGTPLSIALAKAGRKTALVESQHVGGTCINVGCTPTKTMVASARIAYLARRAADYGIRCGPVGVDLGASSPAQAGNCGRLPRRGAASTGRCQECRAHFRRSALHRSQRRRGEAHCRRHADIDRRHAFSSIPALGQHDPTSPDSIQ